MNQPDNEALSRAAEDLRAIDQAARGLSDTMGGSLRGAMERAIFGGARLSDVLRGLAGEMARGGLRDALAPVTTAIGQGLGHAVAGAAGVLAGGLGTAVRGFAKGGIVASATPFVVGGQPAVMGEAGPEAILPLARGTDGRLGVRGGGGVQVTLNIATPDADSFQRSRSQVAAALARAVERGAARL